MLTYLEIALRSAKPAKPQTPVRPVDKLEEVSPHTKGPVSTVKAGAACGSPNCDGCYMVHPATGATIHPPKCGEDYRTWLERWEAKGKVQ